MRALLLGILLGLSISGCGGGGGGGDDSTATETEQSQSNSGSGDTSAGDDTGGDTGQDTDKSALDQALQSGDSSGLQSPTTLLAQALAEIDRLEAFQRDLITGTSIGGALSYPVPRSSHFISAAYGDGVPILRGSHSGKPLASAVEIEGERGAGIGFEFYRPESTASGLDAFAAGLLRWLAGDRLPAGLALAGIDATDLDSWLAQQFPDSTTTHCPAGLAPECLDGAQVLLISDRTTDGDGSALQDLVASARERGIGTIYIHTRGWNSDPLGDALLAQFSLSRGDYPGNYFVEDSLDWPGSDAMLDAMQANNAIKTALLHFEAQDFSIDWSACTKSVGKTECDQLPDLRAALLDGAGELRGMLAALDSRGQPLFEQRGRRLMKLLVLLGDLWRREIHYPMRKETAATIDFMQALFADYSVHYLRDVQQAQQDLGSFSDRLSTEPQTARRQISLQLRGDHFTALGAYLPPGQVLRVTRNDNSAAELALRINTQRTGSTRLWDEYSRPRFLASPSIPLASGQTVAVTSPYGGTLQLVHSSAPDPVSVSLTVEGAAQHPYLQYADDMDQMAFAAALQASSLSWAEIRSPFAEIHSLRQRLNESINDSRYAGSSAAFLDDLFEYVLRDAYTLAGFQGDGVELAPAVAQRCDMLGWDCASPDIHGLPAVQHINVDLFAHCGAGCSGNPYDQSWPLDPYGWGESHELGHNLQRARLKIHGGRSGEVSNNIFPLHKNWRLRTERSEDLASSRIAYRSAFDTLRAGAASATPYQVAYDAIWADSSYAADNGERMAFYAQLPQLWREITAVDSQGWDIFTLLYLSERQFDRLDAESWNSARSKFGMGAFADKPALTGNEFMLLQTSFLSGRDLRPLWDTWGVDYGSDTAAQLDALALPAQEKVIWVGPDSNDWGQIEKVAIREDMVWPF
ncbi:ImpA family metalloprotease [Microbulbifer taiwanensis]|uniref:ImpA family metalloprotease n=1 Tax=Microbulbifer taiwanensis TaxID=986746 RepID=A0ABW1YS45_9GAMM|nr:ImpA family metalloprotease [Microbulbifer taiwanensis]